jgi:ABC-type nitrate/sulfonate/bicarbonate transport system substrate-binding protein
MTHSLSRRNFMRSAAFGLAGAALTPALLAGATRRAYAADPLTMQASWVNDAEFMGYFVGIDEGYYKAEGVDFTYVPGGPDVIPESSLLSGKSDISLTSIETTSTAISDQGAKFKIIGAQFQKNPIGVVSLASSNIKEPKDLIGKTLASPPVNLLSVKAMLKLSGVPEDKVKIVPYEYDPTPLIQGNVDATIDFSTDVPFTIKQAGKEASSFLLYDFGFSVFNDIVVVTEDTLKTKRAALVKWLRASRKGWDTNFVDPAKYPTQFADTWFKGTGRTTANDVFSNTAEKPIITTPKGIYAMSEEDIQKNIDALGRVNIKCKPEYFDTTLLGEI